MMMKNLPVFILLFSLFATKLLGQAPNISYTTPQTYNVGIAISALSPTNTGGPVPTGAPMTLLSGLNDPRGLAIDAAGNLYIAENGASKIREIPAGGGSVLTLGSGFSHSIGVAVDGSGNLFVSDQFNSAIKEIPAGNGTVVTIATGLSEPYGIALDGHGYIYTCELTGNDVKKIPVGGGTPVVYATGFNSPTGIAVDAAGNVYVADRGNNAVKEIKVSDKSIVTLAAGINNVNGLAVDAAGNVYYGASSSFIGEIPAGGGSVIHVGSGFSIIAGLTIDAAGDIFAADNSAGVVKEIAVPGNYSISPALPAGLTINAQTGVITGTPTATSAATNYTVTATNSSGSGTTTINITVSTPSAPAISYTSPQVFNQTVAISPVSPSSTGGPIPSSNGYSISPALPAGLSFNVNTGVISGTPTVASAAANYTVTATNAGGSGTATINITVNAQPVPVISYSTPQVFTQTVAISPVSPTNTGGPIPSSNGYSISPALPAGLSFNVNTGVISGTPSVAHSATDYTVTATNAGGSGTAVINITVNAPAAPVISYSSPQVFSATVAISPVSPTSSGGPIPSSNGYAISPALPSGLIFNVNTGVISGTPTAASAATNYTVTATNAGGSGMATINITVNAQPAPSISYSTPHVYPIGTTIASLSPTNTGGAVPASSFTTITSGLGDLRGLAVDAAGNIYLAEVDETQVREIPAGGGSLITLGSGFSHPSGVAVDGSGNVFVADSFNGAIKEIPAGNGPVVTIATGLTGLYGIALDGHGYIYTTQQSGGAITKIPVGGGTAVVIASGFNTPTGIALDASENIYFTERGANAIKEILASNGSVITLATASGNANGIALDATGNVYFADLNNLYIDETPAGGGGGITTIGSGFSSPTCIIFDGSGNLLVGNPSQVIQLQKGGYSISPGLPAGLVFNNSTGLISGTPTTASPATNYVVTATNAAGSSSATINITVNNPISVSYAGPYSFVNNFQINPDITPSSSGVGAGTSKAFTKISSAFSHINGVTADAAGNIYIADNAASAITEIPAGGGANITLGSGFNAPHGVAVDAAGNVYVSDYGNNAVKKIPAGNGAVVTLATGFNHPYGITLDHAGNIYVCDSGNGRVMELPVGGGAATSVGSGFTTPVSVAVDGLGDLYVGDSATHEVYNYEAVNGHTSPFFATSGIPAVTIDDGANLYIAGTAAHYLFEYNTRSSQGYQIATVSMATAVGGCSANPTVYYVTGSPTTLSKMTKTGGFAITPQLPGDLQFNESTGVISGVPAVVAAAANYTVTAYNAFGSVSTAVNIAVTPATSGLSNVTSNIGTLSPAFSTSITNYTIGVANSTTSVDLTPTASSGSNTIKINGTAVASGSAYTLTLNTNVLFTEADIAVYNSANKGIGYYTVMVNRAASSNADLSNLRVSNGTFSPAFTSGNTSYTDVVGSTISSMTVKPFVSESHASVKVNGTAVASGKSSAPISLNEGSNTITVVVTAQDGTTKTYTIAVTRATSNDDHLAGLSLSSGTLSPVFNATTFLYTASVSNPTASITVTPIADNSTATISVNGTVVNSGSPSAAIPLSIGTNTITVFVEASNGVSKKNYKIIVTRPMPTDLLAALTTSRGALSPAFDSGTTHYDVTVGNPYSSVTVKAIAKFSGTSIKVNGTTVASGASSGPIPLNVGPNNVSVVITGRDGTPNTYTITVTRATSNDDLLTGLSLSSGTLSPTFDPNTIVYNADVTNATTSINVTPTTENPTATITVNGMVVHSGSASAAIPLSEGVNNIVTKVTASNGVAKKNYTVRVTRAVNMNWLSALTVSNGVFSPAFDKNTKNYTNVVDNTITSVTVKALARYAGSTITINGATVASGTSSDPISLNLGSNIVSVVLTSPGNLTNTYTINVIRTTSPDDLLSDLVTDAGALTPSFSPTNNGYFVNVANTISSVTVTPTANNSTATIKVNGTAVSSGSASGSITLNVGSNLISIVVKASNNVNTRTYTISVNRAPGGADAFNNSISVTKPAEIVTLADDGIKVHEGISPNGDGINDFLVIDNISQYPDNKLSVMNRNGQLIFEAKGYDNTSKVFDGRSNKTGQLQQPGTYFYQLDYAVNGVVKHKTGFIVLKY